MMRRLPPGRHAIGPSNGTLKVQTHKSGVAARAGHDLQLVVGAWGAAITIADTAEPQLQLHAEAASLRVVAATGGLAPLEDAERDGIALTIRQEVLTGNTITFSSTAVDAIEDRWSVDGELVLNGTSRPVAFELEIAADGSLSGRAVIAQSGWGITPYTGLFGTLKVKDEIEVMIDAELPGLAER
jgi:YceI-like domain